MKMTTDRELMQWALAALDGYARNCKCEGGGGTTDAAEALRARLAKTEEPDWSAAGFIKPRRGWRGLTTQDKREIINQTEPNDRGYVMALVEAKLKGKNIG